MLWMLSVFMLLYAINNGAYGTIREVLLSYVTSGSEVQVSGSLSVLATLLQTKGYTTKLQAFITTAS